MGIIQVSKHDRYQLEIKTQMIAEHSNDNKEQIDLWLFLPPALGISSTGYSSEEFYSDLRTYTRLETPLFHLDDFLSSSASPLVLLERNISPNPSVSVQRVLRQEIKLVPIMLRKLGEESSHGIPIDTNEAILQRWRTIFTTLKSKTLLPKTIACLKIADEMMSNHWEMSLIEDVQLPQEEREHKLVQEVEYRKSQGYMVYTKEGKDEYLFHFGNLGKYLSTVLYLDSRYDVSLKWFRHLAFGAAAGLAMVWALAVQIYALLKYGVDLDRGMSVQLIALFAGFGIFSYILKDRIKATTGRWLTDWLGRYLPDRSKQFMVDDETIPIASSEEKTRFVKVRDLPADIQDMYTNFQEWNPYFLFGSDVLHYQQKTMLHIARARKQFSRFRGVVHIHRFHVWNWIKTLAAPKKNIVVVNDAGKIEQCKAPRIYTVNLLTKVKKGAFVEYKLYRVLLNNRRLVDVQSVDLFN